MLLFDREMCHVHLGETSSVVLALPRGVGRSPSSVLVNRLQSACFPLTSSLLHKDNLDDFKETDVLYLTAVPFVARN